MASPILMFMVLCSCYSLAYGYGGDENGFVVVPSSSFELDETAVVCSNARVNLQQNHSRLWLPLANRHGPCAPKKSSRRPSLADTLRRDRARSSYIMSIASWGTGSEKDDEEKVVNPTHIGNFVNSLEYVVTLGFGTPAVQQTVLIDTGSGLSWIQCKPWCSSSECASQKDPLFDPSRSSTYSSVRCDSALCRNLVGFAYGNGCTNGTDDSWCRFGMTYGDGSRTAGVYSSDRLTLTRVDAVNNFHFGCGHDHRAITTEMYDGLLALSREPLSLVAQTSSVYHRAFSYCLPAENSRSGFLALGVRRPSATSGFLFTPLRTTSSYAKFGFYEVVMTGIAVGGKQLDLPPSAFAAGMMIDTSSAFTYLQSTVYKALRAAFRTAMAAYPLLPHGRYHDTCFNLTGHENVALPKVALTFRGGATINLDVPRGILVEGCLAFQDQGADNILGVLGDVNQRNFEVLYDSSNSKVGFRANAC